MRFCLIDATSNVCVNAVELRSAAEFIPHNNLILAPRHDGDIGWIWNGNGWTNPKMPELTYEMKANRIRTIRNRRLARYVDIINPLRWESLTAEQKVAWQAYRQALLDVPQQEGFPDNVIWPEKPQG